MKITCSISTKMSTFINSSLHFTITCHIACSVSAHMNIFNTKFYNYVVLHVVYVLR